MGEFFYGWRRKTGVVTLVMASVFMGLWVRGCSVIDRIVFTRKPSPYLTSILLSHQGMLWEKTESLTPTGGAFANNLWSVWTINKEWSDPQSLLTTWYPIVKWRWRIFGFDCGVCFNSDGDFRFAFCLIPYWSVTIPLTLISLRLLLSKPRQLTPKKIIEPIPANGA